MFSAPFERPVRRIGRSLLGLAAALALAPMGASVTAAPAAPSKAAPGVCDIYAAGGTPCVAAHSTTRALYAAFNGSLYQVMRASDGATRDIRTLAAGGYANAAAQDTFCAATSCVITIIYDQSGRGNHLTQAPPGPNLKGPMAGEKDILADATAAPVSIGGGHRVYGVYIEPESGYRNNKANGTAVGDEPEGQYAVFDGSHYNAGCCFDYGNAETNSDANGNASMEAIYFGNSSTWGTGMGAGPWVMADLENGLFSGFTRRFNAGAQSVHARFVTAILNGGPNLWALKGGDAQSGPLTTYYSGVRPTGWNPMRKEGAIILGTGGDNSNSSAGTFYEGAMTAGYPSDATDAAVHANIIAARYAPADTTLSLDGLMGTFRPGQAQTATAVFTNNGDVAATGVKLVLPAPSGWSVTAAGPATFASVAPGKTVTATWRIVAPAKPGVSALKVSATYSGRGGPMTNAAVAQKVKVAYPIKINEIRFGASDAATNQFIELFNAGTTPVDISGYQLATRGTTQHCCRLTTIATIPGAAGSGTTVLGGGAYYLVGLTGGYAGGPSANLTFTGNLAGRGGNPTGSLSLVDPATPTPGQDPLMLVVDSVAYGAGTTVILVEGGQHNLGCYVTPPTMAVLPGNSLNRLPNGQDSDVNCADFASSTPTPGAANIAPPAPPLRGGGGGPGRGGAVPPNPAAVAPARQP